jgi:hypothetical protein
MTFSFIQNIEGGILVFGLIYALLWMYCLVDSIRSNFKDPNMKMIWIRIILFGQVIRPDLYLIMGKGTKKTTYTS